MLDQLGETLRRDTVHLPTPCVSSCRSARRGWRARSPSFSTRRRSPLRWLVESAWVVPLALEKPPRSLNLRRRGSALRRRHRRRGSRDLPDRLPMFVKSLATNRRQDGERCPRWWRDLSPEQATCAGRSSADLWGLGVLLWEVSARRRGPVAPGHAGRDEHVQEDRDHTAGGLTDPVTLSVWAKSSTYASLSAPSPRARPRLGAQAVSTRSRRCRGSPRTPGRSCFGRGAVAARAGGGHHMRSQLSASAGRPGDAALTELAGTTEFTGDSSWFADY